ncbi:A-kinase anchor protein 9-like [Cricetulus griseus]|uniref:A-kinase anchor protein 9-like n=1 Tax=Cricetulus griseus TaxID=10029 RepID=A0A9J7HCF4_CRIGR|nr:A-kinase anchor protein 9-like [Cricetulus griseus]
MKDTLDNERELLSNGEQPQPAFPPEEILQELQGHLEEKQKHIIELVNESRKYKRDSLQANQQMEKDRQVHQKTLQVEKEANILGQQKMEELQSKVEELQHLLQEKRHQVHKLDLEGRRLQEGAAWSFTEDRTRNWVLHQKMEEESKDTSYAKLMEMNREKDDSDNDVEIIRQKFQRVAMKIQGHIVQKACDRENTYCCSWGDSRSAKMPPGGCLPALKDIQALETMRWSPATQKDSLIEITRC